MASPLQQPPARRKLIYFALIVLLFTMTLVVRHADARVAGAQVQGIQAQARDLELRETDLGEADLTGSTIRLTLTGSRGLVVTYLWYQSDQKKLRHEWNELELLVKSIITLQPHFINPWIFQSWNLAYNVSAESDRIRDKYFYISRGIELIADGERRNRNSPDLRSMLGFYYRDKFGISDQANTLQCLLQMSCMEPAERDPQRLRRANGPLDLGELEQFCANHPQVVRRLHELLYRDTPAKVIEFLADNQKIPTRYEEQRPGAPATTLAKLKPPEQQFPVVCPPFSPDGNEPTPQDRLDDDIDSYVLARGWLSYALLPLPPSDPELGPGIRIDPDDFKKYRLPHRGMMIILLRQQPSQTQTAHAERLEREGWYDGKWKVADWFAPRVVELGRKSTYALEAWQRACQMWTKHGADNGFYFDEAKHKLLEERAKKFRDAAGVAANEVPDILPEDPNLGPEMHEDFKAHALLRWYARGRGLTNYPHFYYQSQVLSGQDLPHENALQARKWFFQAEQMA